MKLLLTSAGIANETIKKEFLRLAGKNAEDITIGFIPTAAYVEEDHSWLEEDVESLRKAGVGKIESVDIATMEKDEWLPALERSDVVWVNGGNTYYLLEQVRKSGLAEELARLLETRLYVGSSAGSIIVGPDLAINRYFPEEDEERYRLRHHDGTEDITGLKYVPFTVFPHLNNPLFEQPTMENIEQFAETAPYPVYAIDDDTAVSVVDGMIEVITEGVYKVFDEV